MTFLFANSLSTLHWKIVEHGMNLDTLSSYSWARVVSTYINDSLITKAKAKKGGEASIGVVSGCAILILNCVVSIACEDKHHTTNPWQGERNSCNF
ncbi:hypothetical protein GBA52_023741 [Prunus armeniaca]|nr:hypothetical protein GBA52_023741 [Prunus armeniaca]